MNSLINCVFEKFKKDCNVIQQTRFLVIQKQYPIWTSKTIFLLLEKEVTPTWPAAIQIESASQSLASPKVQEDLLRLVM